jgi:hypothetical protein
MSPYLAHGACRPKRHCREEIAMAQTDGTGGSKRIDYQRVPAAMKIFLSANDPRPAFVLRKLFRAIYPRAELC